MCQITLDKFTVQRLENKEGRKHLIRSAFFHPSIKTKKIGAVIDDNPVIVEYYSSPVGLFYTVKLANNF